MNHSKLDYILKVRVPVTIFVIILSFTITYYVSRPERDGIGYQPEQPIPFSHKLHAGEMNIDCQYCHTTVTKSRFASIPSVQTCMNCHSVARKNRQAIIQLTEMYQKNIPLQWKRVHRLADFAYFNHSVHVNRGIDCAECHGDVKNMDVIKQVSSFTMASCLDCHRNAQLKLTYISNVKNGPENCFACHR